MRSLSRYNQADPTLSCRRWYSKTGGLGERVTSERASRDFGEEICSCVYHLSKFQIPSQKAVILLPTKQTKSLARTDPITTFRFVSKPLQLETTLPQELARPFLYHCIAEKNTGAMSTDVASKTEITLKGSVDIVSEFFFTAINSILYQRGASLRCTLRWTTYFGNKALSRSFF